mmetsp:Transcript_16460/g.54697  ORF Transcript_16460/g.54697 Transcript_16460/m.54697 type:complete len:238 (-) Transcript_16460:339-1052(-)
MGPCSARSPASAGRPARSSTRSPRTRARPPPRPRAVWTRARGSPSSTSSPPSSATCRARERRARRRPPAPATRRRRSTASAPPLSTWPSRVRGRLCPSLRRRRCLRSTCLRGGRPRPFRSAPTPFWRSASPPSPLRAALRRPPPKTSLSRWRRVSRRGWGARSLRSEERWDPLPPPLPPLPPRRGRRAARTRRRRHRERVPPFPRGCTRCLRRSRRRPLPRRASPTPTDRRAASPRA